ncbi:MAG: alpha/beta hydrolase [Methylophilaceae bacterium]
MLDAIKIETSLPIQQSVIWLHGLGADGHDFAPIVPQLQLDNTRFIFPHAPIRPVTLNHGYAMPAWFDIYGLGGNDKQDVDGMQLMAEEIHALIQNQLDDGIPSHRIVLAGFSQGGAMAAFCALQYPQPLAGLMMLSSYLPQKHEITQQIHPANRDLPIFLAHGVWDDIIPLNSYQQMLQILNDAGCATEAHEYPMAHSVCDEEIKQISDYLQRIFC